MPMSTECMEKGKLSDRVHRINVLAEAEDDAPICWVCLDHASFDRPLIHPCKCPSWCHSSCIARWQLQSAGTRREKFCDFCSSELPDWKSVLTPAPGATAPAVMNVNFDNKTYSFQVAPGADGYRQFTEAIRKAFRLPEDSELNITFTCDEPSSAGSLLTLAGPGAYDAAVHCASVSAARRSVSGDHSSSSSGSSSGAASPSFQRQQQQQGFIRSGLIRSDRDVDLVQRDQDRDLIERSRPMFHELDLAAAGIGRERSSSSSSGDGDSSSNYQIMQRRPSSSTSSSRDFQDLIIDRQISSSSSGDSSRSAGDAPCSPGSSTGSDLDPQLLLRDSATAAAAAATSSSAAAAADTHYDPSASPPGSESGRRLSRSSSSSSSSRSTASQTSLSELGMNSSSSSSAADRECGRALSTASNSSAASSSGSSSNRRSSGLGKKLRDAISDLLLSK